MKALTLVLLVVMGSGCGASPPEHSMQPDNELQRRGLEQLDRIDGTHGRQVVDSLHDHHPQLASYILEFPFGSVYEALQLDAASAELCVVAMLAAMGNARPQLEVHVAAALHVGAEPREVMQAIYQSAVYAGFPAAINATQAAAAVFSREDVDYREERIDHETPSDWRARGAKHLETLGPGQREVLDRAFEGLGSRLPAWVEEYAYGRILSRPSLSRRKRQLCTVAMLAALGIGPQLRFHVAAARRIGISRRDLEDVMYLLVPYAGIPRSINGIAALLEVEGASE